VNVFVWDQKGRILQKIKKVPMISNGAENRKRFCSNNPQVGARLKKLREFACLVSLILTSCIGPVPGHTIDHGRPQSTPQKIEYGTIPITPVPGNDKNRLSSIHFAGYASPSVALDGKWGALGISCYGLFGPGPTFISGDCLCTIVDLDAMDDGRAPDGLVNVMQSAPNRRLGEGGVKFMPGCATGRQMCAAITPAPSLHPSKISFFREHGHLGPTPYYDLSPSDAKARETYCTYAIGEMN
jgi:hypothetical protein